MMMEANEPDFNYGGIYTYADYLRWQIHEQVEIIKGKVFRMSPAPRNLHQKISGNIHGPLWYFLKNKKCAVYTAPFDVRLPVRSKEDKDIITVVQPDLCVVCDPSKLDERGCIGAPDIVVEILSPGNNKKELQNKFEVYEESGVKEYWIIHPDEKTFIKYVLNNEGKFIGSKMLTMGEEITSDILPGLTVSIDDIFNT